MNIIDLNIMNTLFHTPYTSQRTLADATGYSLGKVNQSLANLQAEGYLDIRYRLTPKAREEQEAKSPRRAVILAAGFGLRMIPINREIPKGLLEVHGEPLIERQIRQLQEAGIRDITIVVGFMKESYEYLIDLYDVRLLVNRFYGEKNNLHSLALAAGTLENTYIVPCDIWCRENPFSRNEWYSWYMVSNRQTEESDVRVNRKMELVSVDEEASGNAMIGIAYLLKEDGRWLADRLQQMDHRRSCANAFWEQALWENGKMKIHARLMDDHLVAEINTYEQLREMDSRSPHLQSGILEQIAGVLHCPVHQIRNIEMLKKGMTNRSFFFEQQDKRYIMRIPGEGSGALVNRRQEYEVYQAIRDLEISDKVVLFDPETGYKMTEYLADAHSCDWKNPEETKQCMALLRQFHQSGLQVHHTFDVFERMEFYESLWEGQPSCYRDYEETKEKMYAIGRYLDRQPKNWTLCHIDANPDNFLINKEGIHLIDWEYAGMQDSDIDIAMFAIYTLEDREGIDQQIDLYYTEGCPEEIRQKIYGYIAICGLLWSNWCEYKHHQGVEFGEYSLRQYRYAKEFYRYLEPVLTDADKKGEKKNG